jgi:hypothetical protein
VFPYCCAVPITDLAKPPDVDDDALDITLTPTIEEVLMEDFSKFSTMPRLRDHYQVPIVPKRPVSMAGL